jgi:hypothetical protein
MARAADVRPAEFTMLTHRDNATATHRAQDQGKALPTSERIGIHHVTHHRRMHRRC